MDDEPELTFNRIQLQDEDLDFGFLEPIQICDSESLKPQSKSYDFTGKSANQNQKISMQQNNESIPKLKAINPLQKFKDYPEAQLQSITNFFMHNKVFPGILGVFGQINQKMYKPLPDDIFGNMDHQIFASHQINQSQGLRKLFNDGNQSTQIKLIQSLQQLQTKISEVHKKVFSSISFNKTIGNAFFDHFENFAFLQNQSDFINNFQQNLKSFVFNAKKIRGPSIDLILNIYQFWMRGFRDFVNQIWRHSQKFALNFFKKRQQNDRSSQKNSQDYVNDFKSSTSSQFGCQKEKRKQWTQKQIQILNKLIDSETIFSGDKLKQLSDQFGRTTSSISSKIQKIIKEKKMEEGQSKQGDIPLFKKITQILNAFPDGLNKDQVLQKVSIEYQMGIDDSWKKSVTQLLSSNKQIVRKKGTFKIKLQDIDRFQRSDKTFKDRVIQCLLNCANNQADLKTIADKYLDLYGFSQGYRINQIQKLKTLQANISKTLCRYDVFDKKKSRTLYFYHKHKNSAQKQSMDQEINSFLY